MASARDQRELGVLPQVQPLGARPGGWLRRGWRVSGVGLERLLNDLLAQEIPLTDICRVSTRCVTFYVPYAQSEQAEELIRRRGYELAALPAEGWLRRALTIRRRRFLAAFCALAASSSP